MDSLGAIVDYESDDDSIEETPPHNLQLLPEGSPVPDEMPEETPICPRVGEEYQVEIPEWPLEPESVPADNRFLIGLPVPLTWVDEQENNGRMPVPGTGTSHWSETEVKGLVLGLYIFGKELRLVRQFIESKSMGDLLAYYYGNFYKSEAFKKWADCRKARTRKCIVGVRIFTGWRQQLLVSRLLSAMPQDKHESILEAIKSFNENIISLNDFVFFLRAMISLQTFIDAVAIGKGREDLTVPGPPDSGRAAHPAPARPEIPSGKAWSALTTPEIIKFLTGDFRLSKARANDIFWEAIWPRLLAGGWHSEQPRDFIGSKNSLVFLMPGIKKFSRKLTKGEHYYNCVSDVLKKVAAEPGLLEIENVIAGNVDGEWGPETTSACSKEYLRPKVRTRDGSDLMRFMVVDTSMLHDGKRIRVRDLKSLPSDIDFGKEPVRMEGPSRMAIYSDSSDSEYDHQSRGRKQDSGLGKASDGNQVQINGPQVEGIDLGGSLVINAVTNGHVETTSVVNDVKGHFGKFSRSSKPKAHKYLSPVPKRRRLSGCKQQGASQKGLSISKGNNSSEIDHNGSLLSAAVDKGREGDHQQRKRKMKFLVKDVMKEETEPDLGISGMGETVQGESTAKPVLFNKPKVVCAGTSPRKKKVKEPKVCENKPIPGLEVMVDQPKIELDSSVQVTQFVEAATPTKRKRKMSNLFREALQNDDNSMPYLIDGAEIGVDLTQHDSGLSRKPKKVVRRKSKPSVKEVKKETELPSVSDSAPIGEVRQETDIQMPKSQVVKEEHQDLNLNEPETTPMDVGTSGTNAQEPSEPDNLSSGRRVSRRNRPPTARALEAVANGFLGGPKQRTVSTSSRRTRMSGEASRRSRKVEEKVSPIPSEDANAIMLSVTVTDDSKKENNNQPVVGLTGDIQPNLKALDHAVNLELST